MGIREISTKHQCGHVAVNINKSFSRLPLFSVHLIRIVKYPTIFSLVTPITMLYKKSSLAVLIKIVTYEVRYASTVGFADLNTLSRRILNWLINVFYWSAYEPRIFTAAQLRSNSVIEAISIYDNANSSMVSGILGPHPRPSVTTTEPYLFACVAPNIATERSDLHLPPIIRSFFPKYTRVNRLSITKSRVPKIPILRLSRVVHISKRTQPESIMGDVEKSLPAGVMIYISIEIEVCIARENRMALQINRRHKVDLHPKIIAQGAILGMPYSASLVTLYQILVQGFQQWRHQACWILRPVRASVPLWGEPPFRGGVSHLDAVG